MTLEEQYDICKVRGHVSDGMVTASPTPWYRCKFCRTQYSFTPPKLVESNGTIPQGRRNEA